MQIPSDLPQPVQGSARLARAERVAPRSAPRNQAAEQAPALEAGSPRDRAQNALTQVQERIQNAQAQLDQRIQSALDAGGGDEVREAGAKAQRSLQGAANRALSQFQQSLAKAIADYYHPAEPELRGTVDALFERPQRELADLRSRVAELRGKLEPADLSQEIERLRASLESALDLARTALVPAAGVDQASFSAEALRRVQE
jgi:hypothetical protein